MAKSKLEYIWLDGYHPTQNMRSKLKSLTILVEILKIVQYGLLMEVPPSKQRGTRLTAF